MRRGPDWSYTACSAMCVKTRDRRFCQTTKPLARKVSGPGLALPRSLLRQHCRWSDARPGSSRLCTETRQGPNATVSATLVSSRHRGVLWAACTRAACCHLRAFSSAMSALVGFCVTAQCDSVSSQGGFYFWGMAWRWSLPGAALILAGSLLWVALSRSHLPSAGTEALAKDATPGAKSVAGLRREKAALVEEKHALMQQPAAAFSATTPVGSQAHVLGGLLGLGIDGGGECRKKHSAECKC